MRRTNNVCALRNALAVGAAFWSASAVVSFDIQSPISYWPVGDVEWEFNLVSSPPNVPVVSGGSPLMDGSTSWDDAVEVAFNELNGIIPDSVLTMTANKNSGVVAGSADGVNNVAFASTVYGDAWGGSTLGISISRWSGNGRVENDVLFNNTKVWNAYTGNLQGGVNDIRRVALHEFGHSLGLDHPDQATPPQVVSAIMNSSSSNVDSLAADDIAGVLSLYGAIRPLQITYQPQDVSVVQNTGAPFAIGVSGSETITYQWQFSDNGSTWNTVGGAVFNPISFSNVQLADNGRQFRVMVTDYLGTTTLTSDPATLTVTAAASAMSVTAHPLDATVTDGNVATFFFDVTGSPTPEFQWQMSTDSGANWADMDEGDIGTGTTISTLSVRATSSVPSGSQFRCVATQAGAPPTVETSNAATLTVNPVSQDPVYGVGKFRDFTQSSAGAPVFNPPSSEPWEGFAVILGQAETDFTSVTVTPPGGSALALEWDTEELEWVLEVDQTFMTQAELNAVFPDSASPYTFDFNLSGGGSASSDIVLNGGIFPEALQTSNFAAAQSVDPTSDFTITWNASPSGTVNDFIIVDVMNELGDSVYTSDKPGGPAPLDGTATSVVLPAGTLLPGLTYDVELLILDVADTVTGDLAGATGYSFYSTATHFDLLTRIAPSIATHPQNADATEGDDVSFTVAVLGNPTPTLQWRKGGVNIPGATASTLNLTNVQSGDAGLYDVVATNTLGNATSNGATLTVSSPTIPPAPTQPGGTDVYSGGFTVSWAAVPGATGYLLDLSTSSVFASYVAGYEKRDVGNVLSYNVTGLPPGQYYFRVFAYNGLGTGPASPTGTVTTVASRFLSLSTRGQTGPSDGVLILGFSISTTQPKQLLIRAAGPALQAAPFDILTAIDDSRLVLTQFQGPVIPPGNDDWDDSDTNLMSAMASVFAFGYPAGSADSAYLATLNAGLYTVAAETVTGDAGVTIVELYELDDVGQFDSISTRAFVGAGDFVLIPGVALGGGTSRLLVRAVGRTLGEAPFNVPGVLDDPVLSVLPPNGPQIAGNDDWEEDGPEAAAEIEAISDSVFLFGLPSGSPDAVVLIDLAEGPYTFIVSGKNGATGIVLLELYRVP